MAQFILVYTHPSEGEQRFELARGRSYRIGSRPDNDVVIDQKDVSRHHAVLRVQDGGLQITDLDSKNGTFINGARVASATFNCGDMVHLSSARLVIVEISTGAYPMTPDVIALAEDDSDSVRGEETQKYRSEASIEDVVSLLETTASAVRRGALAEPLAWAVERLGLDGALVLYRDRDGSVAMVSSAGDLGRLARKSEVLTRIANDDSLVRATGTRVQQITEAGESLLVATAGPQHLLVVRYSGRPPAIGDLRSVIAAVDAVLASGRARRQEGGGPPEPPAATGPPPPALPQDDLDLDLLAGGDLAAARSAFETWMIRRALEANDGNQSRAAAELGLSRGGLIKKMKKLGL
jgi:pSer/pThr/pTyr-binding forkhead associated (FHA) protein